MLVVGLFCLRNWIQSYEVRSHGKHCLGSSFVPQIRGAARVRAIYAVESIGQFSSSPAFSREKGMRMICQCDPESEREHG